MDVAVSDLRANLSEWLGRARDGDEVVITDRGSPVARLIGIDSTAVLERLVADGAIGPAERTRPRATGKSRPRPRKPVAGRITDQRR